LPYIVIHRFLAVVICRSSGKVSTASLLDTIGKKPVKVSIRHNGNPIDVYAGEPAPSQIIGAEPLFCLLA
jgi:hypothetical protein